MDDNGFVLKVEPPDLALDQALDQYLLVHPGGTGLQEDNFVQPQSSREPAIILARSQEQCQSEQKGGLSHQGAYFGEVTNERMENTEKEEEQDLEDTHQNVEDIVRNVMQVRGIESLSPPPPDAGNSPSTQRQPLKEKSSNNANATRFTTAKRVHYFHPVLPYGFRYMFRKRSKSTVMGVVATKTVSKGQCFGPFNGSLVNGDGEDDIESMWELCLRGSVHYYVDGRHDIHNNWLHHINPARTKKEQNLEAFQHYGDIYYRALDTIQPGTELRVFYSYEYSEKVGCKLMLECLDYNEDTDDFKCCVCNGRYKSSKSMLRHIKFQHTSDKVSSKVQLPDFASDPFNSDMCGPSSNTTASSYLAKFADLVKTKESVAQHDVIQKSSSSSVCSNHFQEQILAEEYSTESLPNLGNSFIQRDATRSTRQTKRSINNSVPKARGEDVLMTRVMTDAGSRENHSCPTCGKTFTHEGKLKSHQLFHLSTVSEFKCEVCGEIFKSFQRYTHHKNIHSEDLIGCFLCHNKYRHQSGCTRHIRNGHHLKKLGTETFFCTICFGVFQGEAEAKAHRAVCTKSSKGVRERRKERDKEENNGKDYERGEDESARLAGLIKCKKSSQLQIVRVESVDCNDDDKKDTNDGWIDPDEELDLYHEICGFRRDSGFGSLDTPRGDNRIDNPSSKANVASASERDSPNSASAVSSIDNASRDGNMSNGSELGSFYSASGSDSVDIASEASSFDAASDGDSVDNASFTDNMDTSSRYNNLRPKVSKEKYKRSSLSNKESGETIHRSGHSQQHRSHHSHQETLRDAENDTDKFGRPFDFRNRPRPFQCKVCGRWYATLTDMKVHLKRVHGPSKKASPTGPSQRFYRCDHCPRTFSSESAFTNHQVDHTGAKPFKCEPCTKWFKTSQLLQAHRNRIHRKQNLKHECRLCGKKFLQPHQLRKHEQRHRGERNFSCAICEKTFTAKFALQNHMFIHTGEKPFACDRCGKRFSLNIYLVRHKCFLANDTA